MLFHEEFLDVQLRFAQRVAAVTDISLDTALFNWTSLPVRFGIPFSDLRAEHPIWKEFLSRLHVRDDYLETIYRYHYEQMKDSLPMRPQHGCFSFDYLADEQAVRLHFAQRDSPEPGPLSKERVEIRTQELKGMFSYIKSTYPKASRVVSGSWIYHIEAFNRLFPRDFTEKSVISTNDYRSLGLWGQFLDKYGSIKSEMRSSFLQNIESAYTSEELERSFPFSYLKVECGISHFYTFYGVE